MACMPWAGCANQLSGAHRIALGATRGPMGFPLTSPFLCYSLSDENLGTARGCAYTISDWQSSPFQVWRHWWKGV